MDIFVLQFVFESVFYLKNTLNLYVLDNFNILMLKINNN